MLSKKNRLTQKECEILLSGRVQIFHTHSLFIRAKGATEFKAAVAVSKKVFKRAVDRNRTRRVVFSGLRELLDLPIHIMISVKKGLDQDSIEKLREEIRVVEKELRKSFS